MIFRPELAAKVLAGDKTVTRRLCSDNPRSPWWRERCAFEPGRDYAVQAKRGTPSIGRIRIVSVQRCQWLSAISHHEALREGFKSGVAFIEAWRAINGLVPHGTPLWRVEFEVVDG